MKKLVLKHRREEGMALLFALGFLALMLILGLGFVTTSLLAQKIAANNSSRAQARMFARSAAARAMVGILLYNDQLLVADEPKNVDNYDFICSYDEAKRSSDTLVTVNDQLVPAKPETVDSDTKQSVDGSKLSYQVGSEDYTGETSKAKWMFFYDAPTGETGRRIIGRAAFQVLPRQAGRLSLYGVTGGPKVDGDYGQLPHDFRWGRDIAELDLDVTKTLTNWSGSVNVSNIPYQYKKLYDEYSSFFSADAGAKKGWIEYWFAEGKNPILKDAFPAPDPSDKTKKIYYNRFNISDYHYKAEDRNSGDNWYDRFKKRGDGDKGWDGNVTAERKNSEDALEKLTMSAVAYKENHTRDTEVEPSGLPFLKRIGNSGWSFKGNDNTDNDALAALRRQIAANFNDYCDSDSIPTSDVPAADWNVTDKFPVYTGNEKTLYINEVAAELGPIQVTYRKPGSNDYASIQQGDFALQVDGDKAKLKLLVELVNIYDNSDAENSKLLDPAKLEALLGLKQKLGFTYRLSAKYTGTVRFTYILSNQTKNGTARLATDPISADATITAAQTTEPVTITGDAFTELTNGYSVGAGELTLTVENPSEATFTTAVKNAARQAAENGAPSGATNIAVKTIIIQHVDITGRLIPEYTEGGSAKNTQFELLPVLLRANQDIDGGKVIPKNTGVDFVRFDRVNAITLSDSPAESVTALNAGNYVPAINDKFYICGFEAVDPRQNLNPRYTTSSSQSVKSDWKIEPKLLKGDKVESEKLPSLTTETENVPVGTRNVATCKITGGKKNREADPKKHLGFAESDADKETATDPAWLGSGKDDHISTAYIRNAPMVSPWEIGLIHRGRAWQTLNLKGAGGFGDSAAKVDFEDIDSSYSKWTDPGTAYKNGDGAILEFVKTGVACRCMGKIPLTLLRTKVINQGTDEWNGIAAAYNKDIIKMLFSGIRKNQTMKQFYEETKFSAASKQGGTEITADDTVVDGFVEAVDTLYGTDGKDFQLRTQFLNTDYGKSAYTFGLAGIDNDAQQEEIIGKTINLLTVNEVTPPNVFRMIVVAQSIKDVGGIGTTVDVTKIHNGADKKLACQLGHFDFVADPNSWDDNTYFDEITGEVKALVTVERVPSADDVGGLNKDYGRMVVTNIEFID